MEPPAITLSIAFVTGLSYLLSLMFSVQNYGSLADTSTGLPLAELFWQATSTRGGAFGLVFMVWVALGPCVIGSQLSEYPHGIKVALLTPTGTGRVFWAFARDEGLPLSKVWARVNHRLGSPFNAQLCVAVIVGLLGCIYLGSSTAFNAMMSSAVYVIPANTVKSPMSLANHDAERSTIVRTLYQFSPTFCSDVGQCTEVHSLWVMSLE